MSMENGKKKKDCGCLIAIVVALLVVFLLIPSDSEPASEPKTAETQTSVQTEQTENTDAESSAETEETAEEPQEEELESYGPGMYKVGTDMKAREYILIPSGYGYYEVDKDSTGELESILSNDNFEGSRYITVEDGQYVTLQRCTAYPAKYVKKGKVDNSDLANGMYKVGVDIDAGEYKVEPLSDFGYYEVDSTSDCTASLDAIVTNDNIESSAYITVSEGQYLKLSNCQMVK